MRSSLRWNIRSDTASVAGACVLAFGSLLTGCEDETYGPGPDSRDIVFPESNVSYAQHVQPLFDRTCAVSGCHDTATKQSNLSLQSYREATARPGIIVPEDPDGSVLVQRIEGKIQPRMPYNRPPLSDNQIRGIRQWILEGAQNN